jgi:hypothetical protein
MRCHIVQEAARPPEFMEAIWFKSGRHRGDLTGEMPVVVCLSFCGRYVADGFEQAVVVEPSNPSMYWLTVRAAGKEIREHGTAIATALAEGSRYAVVSGNSQSAEQTVRGLMAAYPSLVAVEELAELQAAVLDMAQGLRITHEQLTAEVAARTAELNAAMERIRVADAEKSRLLAHGSELVEDGRRRISAEIHDDLNAVLVSVRMRAEALASTAVENGAEETVRAVKRKFECEPKCLWAVMTREEGFDPRHRPPPWSSPVRVIRNRRECATRPTWRCG